MNVRKRERVKRSNLESLIAVISKVSSRSRGRVYRKTLEVVQVVLVLSLDILHSGGGL